MDAGLGLQVDLGIPVTVIHDGSVGCLQVEAYSSGPGAQQENEEAAVFVEAVHQLSPLFTWSAAVHANRGPAPPVHVLFNHVQSCGHGAEDEHLGES